MGLFDFYLSTEKQIERHTRRITNRDSTPEDREASARWLSDQGTPQALLGLLARFDLSLDHQLKDQSEKEQVYGLLSDHGEEAIEPTKAWLKKAKQLASPLRLLGDLAGKEAQLVMALALLEAEQKRNDFKPEKKKALLVWLADVRDARCIAAAAAFLADFDEGVRYAAAEALIAQKDDATKEPLLHLFSRAEESNRLLVRVADVFAQRGWKVDEALAERLPPGFRVRQGRVIAA
jgi:HEAT repeat protein